MNPSICPRAGRAVDQQWGAGMGSFITTKTAIQIFRGLGPKQGDWSRRFVDLLERQSARLGISTVEGWETLREIAAGLVHEAIEAVRRSQRAVRGAAEAANRARIRLKIERRRQEEKDIDADAWEAKLADEGLGGPDDVDRDAWQYTRTVGLMPELESWALA